MHIFLQFNGRFTPKADRLARCLGQHHGFDRFSGVSTGEGHARWLLDPKNTPVRYAHVQALPDLWRGALSRGRPDPGRLAELEARYGNLWRFVIADRNLGHTFLTGTIVPETALRGRALELDTMLSCLQSLFDYFERRLEEDPPDAVFFQVVAAAPALVAAAVCRRLKIPFLTLGKTKYDDRHHLATNALMQPDPVIDRYADPSLSPLPEAWSRLEASRERPKASDHYEADRRNFSRRHGGGLGRMVRGRLAALPEVFRPWQKPYARDPRAPTAWQQWQWETRVQWNFRRIVRSGMFEAGPPAGDYAFLPLSVTPEASTCVVAPEFADQLTLVGALARGLPAGWKLVVKDHLPMCGRRTRAFYEQILRYQNAVLVDPTIRSTELIRGARLTAVIAGTSGWEAMVMGCPVLAFGDAWYLATGLGHRCLNTNRIHEDIREACAIAARFGPAERDRRCARMFQALVDGSFRFEYDMMWSRLDAPQLDARSAQFEDLATRIAARIARARAEGVPDPFDTSAWTRDRTPAAGGGARPAG
ncbi:MAG: hypothetical protein IT577_20670 [Verrucomicrobiae bacterium]|nr:hypothetical protein [Verrucomicrobiae bacterium]